MNKDNIINDNLLNSSNNNNIDIDIDDASHEERQKNVPQQHIGDENMMGGPLLNHETRHDLLSKPPGNDLSKKNNKNDDKPNDKNKTIITSQNIEINSMIHGNLNNVDTIIYKSPNVHDPGPTPIESISVIASSGDTTSGESEEHNINYNEIVCNDDNKIINPLNSEAKSDDNLIDKQISEPKQYVKKIIEKVNSINIDINELSNNQNNKLADVLLISESNSVSNYSSISSTTVNELLIPATSSPPPSSTIVLTEQLTNKWCGETNKDSSQLIQDDEYNLESVYTDNNCTLNDNENQVESQLNDTMDDNVHQNNKNINHHLSLSNDLLNDKISSSTTIKKSPIIMDKRRVEPLKINLNREPIKTIIKIPSTLQSPSSLSSINEEQMSPNSTSTSSVVCSTNVTTSLINNSTISTSTTTVQPKITIKPILKPTQSNHDNPLEQIPKITIKSTINKYTNDEYSMVHNSSIPKITIKKDSNNGCSSTTITTSSTAATINNNNNNNINVISTFNDEEKSTISINEPHIVPKLTIRSSSCSNVLQSEVVPKLTIKMDNQPKSEKIIPKSTVSEQQQQQHEVDATTTTSPLHKPIPKLTIKTGGDCPEVINNASTTLSIDITDNSSNALSTSSKLIINPSGPGSPKTTFAIKASDNVVSSGTAIPKLTIKTIISDEIEKIEKQTSSPPSQHPPVPKLTIKTSSLEVFDSQRSSSDATLTTATQSNLNCTIVKSESIPSTSCEELKLTIKTTSTGSCIIDSSLQTQSTSHLTTMMSPSPSSSSSSCSPSSTPSSSSCLTSPARLSPLPSSSSTSLISPTSTVTVESSVEQQKITVPKLIVKLPKDLSETGKTIVAAASSSSSSYLNSPKSPINKLTIKTIMDDTKNKNEFVPKFSVKVNEIKKYNQNEIENNPLNDSQQNHNDENDKTIVEEEIEAKHELIPKLKIRQAKTGDQAIEEQPIVIPKVTIKPLINPNKQLMLSGGGCTAASGSSTDKNGNDYCDDDMETPTLITPKITIKPIPKPIDITQPLEIVTTTTPLPSTTQTTTFNTQTLNHQLKYNSPTPSTTTTIGPNSPRIVLKINKSKETVTQQHNDDDDNDEQMDTLKQESSINLVNSKNVQENAEIVAEFPVHSMFPTEHIENPQKPQKQLKQTTTTKINHHQSLLAKIMNLSPPQTEIQSLSSIKMVPPQLEIQQQQQNEQQIHIIQNSVNAQNLPIVKSKEQHLLLKRNAMTPIQLPDGIEFKKIKMDSTLSPVTRKLLPDISSMRSKECELNQNTINFMVKSPPQNTGSISSNRSGNLNDNQLGNSSGSHSRLIVNSAIKQQNSLLDGDVITIDSDSNDDDKEDVIRKQLNDEVSIILKNKSKTPQTTSILKQMMLSPTTTSTTITKKSTMPSLSINPKPKSRLPALLPINIEELTLKGILSRTAISPFTKQTDTISKSINASHLLQDQLIDSTLIHSTAPTATTVTTNITQKTASNMNSKPFSRASATTTGSSSILPLATITAVPTPSSTQNLLHQTINPLTSQSTMATDTVSILPTSHHNHQHQHQLNHKNTALTNDSTIPKSNVFNLNKNILYNQQQSHKLLHQQTIKKDSTQPLHLQSDGCNKLLESIFSHNNVTQQSQSQFQSHHSQSQYQQQQQQQQQLKIDSTKAHSNLSIALRLQQQQQQQHNNIDDTIIINDDDDDDVADEEGYDGTKGSSASSVTVAATTTNTTSTAAAAAAAAATNVMMATDTGNIDEDEVDDEEEEEDDGDSIDTRTIDEGNSEGIGSSLNPATDEDTGDVKKIIDNNIIMLMNNDNGSSSDCIMIENNGNESNTINSIVTSAGYGGDDSRDANLISFVRNFQIQQQHQEMHMKNHQQQFQQQQQQKQQSQRQQQLINHLQSDIKSTTTTTTTTTTLESMVNTTDRDSGVDISNPAKSLDDNNIDTMDIDTIAEDSLLSVDHQPSIVKRGRGRPRKDGTTTPTVSNKNKSKNDEEKSKRKFANILMDEHNLNTDEIQFDDNSINNNNNNNNNNNDDDDADDDNNDMNRTNNNNNNNNIRNEFHLAQSSSSSSSTLLMTGGQIDRTIQDQSSITYNSSNIVGNTNTTTTTTSTMLNNNNNIINHNENSNTINNLLIDNNTTEIVVLDDDSIEGSCSIGGGLNDCCDNDIDIQSSQSIGDLSITSIQSSDGTQIVESTTQTTTTSTTIAVTPITITATNTTTITANTTITPPPSSSSSSSLLIPNSTLQLTPLTAGGTNRKRRIIPADDDDESPTFHPLGRGAKRGGGRGGRGGGKGRGQKYKRNHLNLTDKLNDCGADAGSGGSGNGNGNGNVGVGFSGIFTTPDGKDRNRRKAILKETTTPALQVFEEETRMSTDSFTQMRTTTSDFLINNNDESQCSVLSYTSGVTSTTENTSSRKRNKCEIDYEGKTEFTVDMIAEYDWPPPKGCCPARNRDTYMLQEQVAEYLGVKSFKRKYPDLPRRMVEMEERNYLMEKGMVSEKMCDLGLTAVLASDILDIMNNDFYEKYEDYRRYVRDKHIKDIQTRHKAVLQGAVVKNLSARENAIRTASSWNMNFNRSRKEDRRQCLDLQNLIIQLPETNRKLMCRPNKSTAPSNYPIALVPGQYQEFYRHYSAAELLCYPINTAIADPIELDKKLKEISLHRRQNSNSVNNNNNNDNSKIVNIKLEQNSDDENDNIVRNENDDDKDHINDENVDENDNKNDSTTDSSTDDDSCGSNSDTEDDTSSSSSSSDSDHFDDNELITELGDDNKRNNTINKKKLQKCINKSTNNSKKTCEVCDKTQYSNQYNKPEVFIKCSTCFKQAHPSCIDMPPRMVQRVEIYRWQCRECKVCIKCKQSSNNDKMLYCDQCDRGFHIYCIGLRSIPEGRWHCSICTVCTECGVRKPEGHKDDTLTMYQRNKLQSTAKWTHEYHINNITNLREHISMLCVPCVRGRPPTAKTTATTSTITTIYK